VIGPNGAGKTTFFNLISGQLAPTMGEIRFRDTPLAGLAPHAIVKLGIARSFQRVNIFPRLSVFENLQAALIAHHGHAFNLVRRGATLHRAEVEAALGAVGLADDRTKLAGLLAHGKQKQLELALALATDPDLLLLDEPTAGMSPQETTEIIRSIGGLAAERGLTLLFTEHDMDVVFTIADRISVLHHGELITSGPPEEVRADKEVQRVYLGGGNGPA